MKNKLKKYLGNPFFTKLIKNISNPKIVVLCYHDICHDDESIDSWLRIKQHRFERQLLLLSEIGTFLYPDQLFDHQFSPNRKLNFIVTFDDGFVNNYNLALPVLKKLHIPALFFISTKHIHSGDPFWFDWITTPIQRHSINRINLTSQGLKTYFFSKNNEDRWTTIQELLVDIKKIGNFDHSYVEPIINYFKQEFMDCQKEILEKFRPLNKSEIIDMKDSGLCFFGSHAHNHYILTHLDESSLINELNLSKKLLEQLLNEKVNSIAYPNGNYSSTIIKECQNLGYKFGFLADSGFYTKDTKSFEIPRYLIGGHESINTILYKINKDLLIS